MGVNHKNFHNGQNYADLAEEEKMENELGDDDMEDQEAVEMINK